MEQDLLEDSERSEEKTLREKKISEEYLREFELSGEEKDTYLRNIDTALKTLGRMNLPIQAELADIRALLTALGENTDPLFESLAFDREDSGLPTHWQLLTLLGQKRHVLDKIDRINSRIELDLSSQIYEPPAPHDSGSLSQRVYKKMDRNAGLVTQLTQRGMMELLDYPDVEPVDTLNEIATQRARALFYHKLFEDDHLVDADVKDVMTARPGQLPPAFTFMDARLEKRDWNSRFTKWRVHVGTYAIVQDEVFGAEGAGLFLKYIVDFYVKRGKQGDVATGKKELTRKFTNLMDLYAGYPPELVYDALVAEENLEPAGVTLYTIGPFYSSSSAHSEGKLPEDILEIVKENPEEYLLAGSENVVERERKDISSIFKRKPIFSGGEVQLDEYTARKPGKKSFYYVPSTGVEGPLTELLESIGDATSDSLFLYSTGGETFVRIR